ncbi:hypothetical protein [Acetivibrio saccincola]|jgi:hypothetical protein|uniref:DUF8042 domain-containing protein n=1 Tax=Acetivibrio saccincola TaxID=1677857 RepID=A0A2K9E419_9FIRM|nr:hypothetical protein [Acetivibrio saccincola]AUG57138.1 hypothetical protein HVS_06050 [Acetivibrio saccincola]AUG58866.1 hypothetical protein HVS_15085 [Acetivibrio saccincola]NLW27830.1 hypothetical protein [Acetivibrio saccincola]PQQ66045.1 hypothetical protein B9R14_04195 [Acetivibrio saccincola]HOA97186.1 hypothetical protein [Acetivibrio saccincola]
MDKNIQVVKHIFPLLQTMEKGINHIQKRLSELRYEEARTVLEDTMHGIICIEKAIKNMQEMLPDSQIDVLTAKIKDCMSKVVENYESEVASNLEEHIQNEMLPIFSDWKAEVERSLSIFNVSTDILSN